MVFLPSSFVDQDNPVDRFPLAGWEAFLVHWDQDGRVERVMVR